MSPESFSNGMKIIGGTMMLTTAGAAGGPLAVAWGIFMGLDNVRAGMTNLNTVVHDTAEGLGASPGVAATVDVLATMPGLPGAAHRGLTSASTKLARGAVVLEGEAAAGKAAGAVGKEVAKEVAEHPGQAAAAGAKAAEAATSGGQAAAGGARASAEIEMVDPFKLRYSQTTAGAGGDAAGLRQAIGTEGIGAVSPIDVVRTPSGLVTIDNTRPAVAREFGIREVPARIHAMDEPLPPADSGRFGGAKTWGEALKYRTSTQVPSLPPYGTPKPPKLIGG
jgi:hypothetical protein